MAQSELQDIRSHKAAESLSKYDIVELDASNPPKLQSPGSSGNRARGILYEDAGADEDVSILVNGPTRATAAESIAEGDFITGDTNGEAVTATTGDVPIAIAQEDAVSGDQFEIIVVPGLQARP